MSCVSTPWVHGSIGFGVAVIGFGIAGFCNDKPRFAITLLFGLAIIAILVYCVSAKKSLVVGYVLGAIAVLVTAYSGNKTVLGGKKRI